MLHALGANVYYGTVGPPHANWLGHVTDDPQDVMSNVRPADLRLDALHLDAGHDDYYGHGGSWWDVRNSFFLERLDAPPSPLPSPPSNVEVTNAPLPVPPPLGVPVAGQTTPEVDARRIQLSWRPPEQQQSVSFLVTRNDGRTELSLTEPLRPLFGTSLVDFGAQGATILYQVQAVSGDGHLSAPVSVRFKVGTGIVDSNGHLLVDTVPPPPVEAPVTVVRRRNRVLLRWNISYEVATDPVGIRGWRVCFAGKCRSVRRPRITLSTRRIRGKFVSIVVVDRAGNTSSRLRLRPIPR
jgi:hypothetical protein